MKVRVIVEDRLFGKTENFVFPYNRIGEIAEVHEFMRNKTIQHCVVTIKRYDVVGDKYEE